MSAIHIYGSHGLLESVVSSKDGIHVPIPAGHTLIERHRGEDWIEFAIMDDANLRPARKSEPKP